MGIKYFESIPAFTQAWDGCTQCIQVCWIILVEVNLKPLLNSPTFIFIAVSEM